MFAADVRYRAADDGCFLLPAGRSVKLSEDGDRTTDDRQDEAELTPTGF